MGSLVDSIIGNSIINARKALSAMTGRHLTAKPNNHIIQESPRVSVEGESNMNIRVHRVANGWVVSKTIENNGSYESETHVCADNDDLIGKVNELVAMFKLQA
jgi:hypothetical protein